jgi:hypothetical protein
MFVPDCQFDRPAFVILSKRHSGTILNQAYMTYNAFSQLIEEQQDHAGAVSGSSPSVQYGYDSGASNSNEVRKNSLTYPNGRVINYLYGTGMDSTLNRVTSIQDNSVEDKGSGVFTQ